MNNNEMKLRRMAEEAIIEENEAVIS